MNRNRYNTIFLTEEKSVVVPILLKRILYIFYTIGYLGLIKYLYDMVSQLGGFVKFVFTLQSESNVIRHTLEDIASVGIQMTYFGWFAIWITFYLIRLKKLSNKWYFHIIVIFLLNLLFIDRTRPIWILFIFPLIILLTIDIKKINILKIVGSGILISLFSIILFNQIGNWVGKTNQELKYGRTSLPIYLQNFVFYGTSSFGYFNQTLIKEDINSFSPERTAYPLMKVLYAISLKDEVVSQINDFYDIPYSTNVGTFLEPFYRDGGFVYVVFGVILYSFGFDYFGYMLLKSRNIFNHILWANLVFVDVIGFFTPKITSTSIWIMIILAFILKIFFRQKRIVFKKV